MAGVRQPSCTTVQCLLADARTWLRFAAHNPLLAARTEPLLTASTLLVAVLALIVTLQLVAGLAALLLPKAAAPEKAAPAKEVCEEATAGAAGRTASIEEYAVVRERPAEVVRFPPTAQGNSRRRGFER